ncbi:MAG: hypothetical protein ABIR92_02990, partial [Gemmatimonadaceae bacterium]
MPPTERQFTDESGIGWTVREIGNPKMPPTLSRLLGPDRRGSGWLAFRSESGVSADDIAEVVVHASLFT